MGSLSRPKFLELDGERLVADVGAGDITAVEPAKLDDLRGQIRLVSLLYRKLLLLLLLWMMLGRGCGILAVRVEFHV